MDVRNYLGFLIMGLINNFFCITVNSSNQSLCAHFHKENFVGVIVWCSITFGIVARSKQIHTLTYLRVFISLYAL